MKAFFTVLLFAALAIAVPVYAGGVSTADIAFQGGAGR